MEIKLSHLVLVIDVLSQLGVNTLANIRNVKKCINKINICFLMAPLYHSAMKNVANVRNNLKVKTIFNILGPLINPAMQICN